MPHNIGDIGQHEPLTKASPALVGFDIGRRITIFPRRRSFSGAIEVSSLAVNPSGTNNCTARWCCFDLTALGSPRVFDTGPNNDLAVGDLRERFWPLMSIGVIGSTL